MHQVLFNNLWVIFYNIIVPYILFIDLFQHFTPVQMSYNNDTMVDDHVNIDEEAVSSTASAILNILQQISISQSNKPPLQHFHSLPKSIIPKRRLSSSSSSFDGFNNGNSDNNINNNDLKHKKQLVYLRGPNKIPTVRYIPSPLSRSNLIKRINSFSVFNWTIENSKLTPLICATQGWKCHPVRKNELHCTSCHSGIIVKLPELKEYDENVRENSTKKLFNNHHDDDHYYNEIFANNNDKYELQFEYRFLDDELDDDEEEDDDIHVYETLVNSYVTRLSTDHYPTCTFLPLLPLTPKDENYYLSPKDMSRELIKFQGRLDILRKHRHKLIGRNFKTQFLSKDEKTFLLQYLQNITTDEDMNIDIDIDIDGNETLSTDMRIFPNIDVILPALLGWDLKLQKFHQTRFLLLKCEGCTRRILLNTSSDSDDDPGDVHGVEELPPCPHRAEIPASEELTEFDETDPDDDGIDLEGEHANWCCMRHGWRIVLEGLRSATP